MNKSRGETILYWLIFILGASVAGYHTFMVNFLVNPWYIALPSAVAVDGLLAYSMDNIRKWSGDKRVASFFGIIIFGTVSAIAQIIYHQTASGIALAPWLLFVATYCIPIASGTGSFVTIAVIQLFEQNGEKKQALETKPTIEVSSPPALVDNWVAQPAGFAVPEKRRPGRPPKTFAAESESPKALKKS